MRVSLLLIAMSLAALIVLAGCSGGASVPAKCADLTGSCRELIDTVCGCGALSAQAETACNNQCNAIVDEKQTDSECAKKVSFWKSKFGC